MPPGQPMPMGAPMPPAQPQPDPAMMQQVAAVERIYDLTVGKYDLTVQAGPAYSTLREELNTVLMELVRAYPPAAPAIMDLIVKTLDIPDADEVADRIQQFAQAQQQGHGDPKAQQAVQQLQSALEQAHGQLQQWQQKAVGFQQQADAAKNDNQIKMLEMQLKSRELDIKDKEADTAQIQAHTDAQRAALEAQQQAREAFMPPPQQQSPFAA